MRRLRLARLAAVNAVFIARISAVQYLSAMTYPGPLAAALIAQEAVNG
jgi:hypothetical protein